MKKITAAAVLSIVLQGCATVAISPKQQELVKSRLPDIAPNQAQVCFIRNGGQAPLWKPDVTENGKKIGELIRNSYFCHGTASGEHKFVASTALDYDREIDMKLNKNTRNYIDYSVNMGFLSGNGELKEINEEQALNKIYDIDN